MSLMQINREVINCRTCPRLVDWREKIAQEKTRRFAEQKYWGKPVPGFGDPHAQLLIVGLAPAAHGANRTGRMFTGDRSGKWLYRALYKAGFANQAESSGPNDGLRLHNCYISALVRCAPPANKPTREEFAHCAGYLKSELTYFYEQWNESSSANAILCLGQLALVHILQILELLAISAFKPRPKFYHGMELSINDRLTIFASYHPSQQNTFTGRLTEKMLDEVFGSINEWLTKSG
ncbi:MAG: uracil-DNA glycosylase [Phycisphaerae bacterium]|nr:uracil-DNA glycosylase [Phycisphaerae bacterium]NIU55370.1 uracil-DNA glycosylase [Phycisphaerae bacterium]NIW91837.1 uracil-DNA glycosylase [Phycisphaerae bacterium]